MVQSKDEKGEEIKHTMFVKGPILGIRYHNTIGEWSKIQ